MKKKKRSWKFSKKSIWMAIAVVLICVAVSVAMIPLIRLLSSEAGQQLIVQKMESFGIFVPLLFVLLQVIQVVIAVIPGGPVPIIGGVLFVVGILAAMWYSHKLKLRNEAPFAITERL